MMMKILRSTMHQALLWLETAKFMTKILNQRDSKENSKELNKTYKKRTQTRFFTKQNLFKLTNFSRSVPMRFSRLRRNNMNRTNWRVSCNIWTGNSKIIKQTWV